MASKITLSTSSKYELVDITGRVREAVGETGVETGVAMVHSLHTTAGVAVNENADPTVRKDIAMAYKEAFPDDLPYQHAEGNSPAHTKAVTAGNSLSVPVQGGDLQLGTWQGIFFCEFDGPRSGRTISVVVLPGK